MRSGSGVRMAAAQAKPHWTALFLFVLTVAVVDQVTKAVVRASLEPGERAELWGTVSVHHVQNPGIAGGGLEGRALLLAVLALMFVAWIHAYFVRTRGFKSGLLIGFGLLLGGGIGNLVDRVRLGWVTDFIRQEDRAYNLADVAIFSGGLLVLAVLLLSLVTGGTRRDPAAGS
jgi:signal peptidase II